MMVVVVVVVGQYLMMIDCLRLFFLNIAKTVRAAITTFFPLRRFIGTA